MATAQRLTALGWDPVVAPFLLIERRNPALPKPVQAVLITSGNALAGLAPSGLPLLAVGDSTAARARAAGFTDVRSAGRDAAALVDLAVTTLDPARGTVLLASGLGQGKQVADGLRARGFRVSRRVVYAALPPRAFPAEAAAAMQSGTLHAALFLSAETAHHFVRLLPSGLRPVLRSIFALAIGKSTADTLHAVAWRQVRLARSPTLDDVLALL